jgi:hypothetical protein
MKVYFERVMVSIMVFNATFNNLSVIPWRSVLLVEETSVDEKTAALPQVTETLYHIMLYIVLLQDTLSHLSYYFQSNVLIIFFISKVYGYKLEL